MEVELSQQKIDYLIDEIAQLHMLYTYPRVMVENGEIVETQTVWASDEAKQLCQRLEETLKQLFEDTKQNKREYNPPETVGQKTISFKVAGFSKYIEKYGWRMNVTETDTAV